MFCKVAHQKVTFLYFRKLTNSIANGNCRKIGIAPDITACIWSNVPIRKLIVEKIVEQADLNITPRLTCNRNAERRPVLEKNNLAKLIFSRYSELTGEITGWRSERADSSGSGS